MPRNSGLPPSCSRPAFECLRHAELCQNGTLEVTFKVGRGYGGGMVGVWRGKGGGKDGRRRGYAVAEGPLQCAILAHIPLLALIVNHKSMPMKSLLFSPGLQSQLQFPSRFLQL